jgi:hypothetical protein
MPASDGTYSTREICQALFASLHQEKLGTQRALARKLELENSITEANVLNRSALAKGFAAIADAISSHIVACTELSRTTRENILRDLASWPGGRCEPNPPPVSFEASECHSLLA